jgi:N-acyl-D-amino-acid deacylase
VAAVGRLTGEAALEIDARGLVIAPGFIDVHTHAEGIEELPRAENFARMGVTTVVLGNCGSSILDVGSFFQRLEATNTSINVATLIGHGTVRSKAMGGSFMRPPATNELAEMKRLVEQAMKDGAVGLSTGLIYLPGAFAKTDELVELAKVIAPYDGIYASHMRSEGGEIDNALAEVFRIAREAGVRAEISHIKVSGKPSWGQAQRVLDLLEQARASGLVITQDQYLYTASSTGLSQLIPEELRETNKFAEVLASPAQKAALVKLMRENLTRGGREDYSYAVIADWKQNRQLNGLNVVEAARRHRGDGSLDAQMELLLEIHAQGGASGIFHGISEEDLQVFLRHPNTMIASDSGVRAWREGVPHPRGYGNNARVLARYVRELKVLRLEDAVRRMTSLPATTFRLKDRGILREGAWGDLVIFDPARVQDEARFDDPHHYASGFMWVLVNGVPVIKQDQHTGRTPGTVLRASSTGAGRASVTEPERAR